MDNTNGNIYTTRELFNDISSDDVFTVTLITDDAISFPPRRNVKLNVTIHLYSPLCPTNTTFVEKMEQSNCSTESYIANIQTDNQTSDGVSGKNNDMQNTSRRVRLNSSVVSKMGTFIVFGLRKKLQTHSDIRHDVGSYLLFEMTNGRYGDKTAATYHFNGFFTQFYPPLRYCILMIKGIRVHK